MKMYRWWCSAVAVTVILSLWVDAKEMTDIEALASQPTRCTYEYAFDMYGAYCAGLRLSKIPSLRSGIEILDFGDNKLQEIQSDTFAPYTDIKLLYLPENQIYSIDKDAFSYLSNLETLDLSKNVILELPDTIFQLTSLRKLYLNENPILHIKLNNLDLKKPIKAPLEMLDISNCKIKKLPDWGILPQMILYNVSHNPLTTLAAGAFSSMCKLSKVDLTEATDKVKLCDMKMTIKWFQEKRVYFQLDDYSKLNSREFENCPMLEMPESLNISYHECRSAYTEIQTVRAYRRTWVTIGGGLAGFLVGFVLLLYVMHRHNVAQIRKNCKTNSKIMVCDKNAAKILINDDI